MKIKLTSEAWIPACAFAYKVSTTAGSSAIGTWTVIFIPQLLTTELERYKGLAFHQLIDYEP